MEAVKHNAEQELAMFDRLPAELRHFLVDLPAGLPIQIVYDIAFKTNSVEEIKAQILKMFEEHNISTEPCLTRPNARKRKI